MKIFKLKKMNLCIDIPDAGSAMVRYRRKRKREYDSPIGFACHKPIKFAELEQALCSLEDGEDNMNQATRAQDTTEASKPDSRVIEANTAPDTLERSDLVLRQASKDAKK